MIERIKQENPQVPISVDGGVSMDNFQALKESGVDRLVSGSFLRDAEKPEDVIQLLQS
jgi:pentose-5-phosphate-3-epimerase